ncbi:MAG: hypothetical protein KGO81_03990 [Bacteroidota bacterium]|nr:hypothetical protein [Bacteroidota bacterium]
MKAVKTIVAGLFIVGLMASPAMAQQKEKLKEHKCTAACKNGKHVYAHGEKGHVCGPECKKKKM